MNWFEVDKEGLRQTLGDRAPHTLIGELLQNAMDETGVSTIDVSIKRLSNAYVQLVVRDDAPNGFSDLSHAYTLFAPSKKKTDPTQRGRFNLGEKLVLALCRKASVISTTGGVVFDDSGRRKTRKRLDAGSEFSGELRMTQQQVEDTQAWLSNLIFPDGIAATFNGEPLSEEVSPVSGGVYTLPTIVAGEDGTLGRTSRKTAVNIYAVGAHGTFDSGWVFELGIPVAEVGGQFHIDVRQRVPLSFNRDSVTNGYRRNLMRIALELGDAAMSGRDYDAGWVSEAIEHSDVRPEVVRSVIRSRFGNKVAVFDPSDQEANQAVVTKGYTVLRGGNFSKDAWKQIRRANALTPSGQIAPTPKPFSPDGKPLKVVQADKLTEAQARLIEAIEYLAPRISAVNTVDVRLAIDPEWGFDGAYSTRGRDKGVMYLDILGHGNAQVRLSAALLETVIHELAHHESSSHLDETFYKATQRIGVKLAMLVAVDETARSYLDSGDGDSDDA